MSCPYHFCIQMTGGERDYPKEHRCMIIADFGCSMMEWSTDKYLNCWVFKSNNWIEVAKLNDKDMP